MIAARLNRQLPSGSPSSRCMTATGNRATVTGSTKRAIDTRRGAHAAAVRVRLEHRGAERGEGPQRRPAQGQQALALEGSPDDGERARQREGGDQAGPDRLGGQVAVAPEDGGVGRGRQRRTSATTAAVNDVAGRCCAAGSGVTRPAPVGSAACPCPSPCPERPERSLRGGRRAPRRPRPCCGRPSRRPRSGRRACARCGWPPRPRRRRG